MRVLTCLLVLMSCLSGGYASTPANLASDPAPLAALDLSSLFPAASADSDWTTIAFVSETSIAVGLCSKGKPDQCSLGLVRWEQGALRPSAQTTQSPADKTQSHLHPSTEGRILTTCYFSCKPALYSADLSQFVRLPSQLSLVSPSGNTVAFKARESWVAYRLSAGLELLRQGDGELYSISDELVVFNDHRAVRTETLDGTPLGAFSVGKSCAEGAQILDRHRLYLDSCKDPRIIDFNGKDLVHFHLPTRRCNGQTAVAAGGNRLLFDCRDRKVSALRNFGETAFEVVTVGNADLEIRDNRQEVVVIDTITGATCFDWRRSYPMSANFHFINIASISPSGEFVAIAWGNALSIYSVPAACETGK